jgi:hypothetical protein
LGIVISEIEANIKGPVRPHVGHEAGKEASEAREDKGQQKDTSPTRPKQTLNKRINKLAIIQLLSLHQSNINMASPTDVWHDHYDDSDGDLVLVSKDGVKFRTYSALIAKSTLVSIAVPRKRLIDVVLSSSCWTGISCRHRTQVVE